MSTPVIRFRIDFANYCNVGPGRIGRREAIHRRDSQSRAAHDLRMSYRRKALSS